MNSKGPTSTSDSSTNDFSGIWNRNNKNQNITDKAEELSAVRPEKGAVRKIKPWGIKSIVGNFLILLVTQALLSIILIAFLAQSSAANTADLTAFVTNSPWIILGSSISMYAVWLGGMAITTYRKGQKSFKKDFWVSFKWYDIFIGLGIALLLFGGVALLSWLAGDVFKLDMSGSDNGSIFSSLDGIWFLIIGVGMASIAGPLCEELFFRGYVFQAIAKSISTHLDKVDNETEEGLGLRFARWMFKVRYGIAAVFSSLVFGFMHFQGVDTFGQWFVVIVTGTLGLVFAIVAIKLRRLGPGIFGHMLYNGGTLLIAYLTMQ